MSTTTGFFDDLVPTEASTSFVRTGLFDDLVPATVNSPSVKTGLFDDLIPRHSSGRSDQAYVDRLNADASELGISGDDYGRIIGYESGHNPAALNPKSGASGLIQFLPSHFMYDDDGTHRTDDQGRPSGWIPNSPAGFRKLSAVEQLETVKRYFKDHLGHGRNFSDLYASVLYPAAVGKPDSFTLFSKGSSAYGQNAQLDRDHDGKITKGEAAASAYGKGYVDPDGVPALLRPVPGTLAKGKVREVAFLPSRQAAAVPANSAPVQTDQLPQVLAPDHPQVLARWAKALPFDLIRYVQFVKNGAKGRFETNQASNFDDGSPEQLDPIKAAWAVADGLRMIKGNGPYYDVHTGKFGNGDAHDEAVVLNLLNPHSAAFQKLVSTVHAGGGAGAAPSDFDAARMAGVGRITSGILARDPALKDATTAGIAGRAFSGAMAPFTTALDLLHTDQEEALPDWTHVASTIADLAAFGGFTGVGAKAAESASATAVRAFLGKTAVSAIGRAASDKVAQTVVEDALVKAIRRTAAGAVGKAGGRALTFVGENAGLQLVPIFGQASDLSATNGKPLSENFLAVGGDAARGLAKLFNPTTLVNGSASERTQAAIMQGLLLLGAGAKGYSAIHELALRAKVDPELVKTVEEYGARATGSPDGAFREGAEPAVATHVGGESTNFRDERVPGESLDISSEPELGRGLISGERGAGNGEISSDLSLPSEKLELTSRKEFSGEPGAAEVSDNLLPKDSSAGSREEASLKASQDPVEVSLPYSNKSLKSLRAFGTKWLQNEVARSARFSVPSMQTDAMLSDRPDLKVTAMDPIQLQLVPLIPSLLEKAKVVSIEDGRVTPGQKLLVAHLQDQNQDYRIWMTLQSSSKGGWVYDHSLTRVEPVRFENSLSGVKGTPNHFSAESGTEPLAGSESYSRPEPALDAPGGETRVDSSWGRSEKAREVAAFKQRLSDLTKLARSGGAPVFSDFTSPDSSGRFVAKDPEFPTGRIDLRETMSSMVLAETLAHEVAHEIDSILETQSSREEAFKAGDPDPKPKPQRGDVEVLFGVTHKWRKDQIFNEMVAVTRALVGAKEIQGREEYYLNQRELWARFLEAVMFQPALAEQHAPTSMSALALKAEKNPRLGEYLSIARGEMLERPVPQGAVSNLLRRLAEPLPKTRRQAYEAEIGKYLGTRVWEEEVLYRAQKAKAVRDVSSLVKEKFQGVEDPPEMLFTAAEGIRRTANGKPEFGALMDRIVGSEGALDQQQLKAEGYSLLEAREDGSQVWRGWRITPHVAEIAYRSLSDEGKRVVDEFTTAAEEAKSIFSREKMAAIFELERQVENSVPFFELDGADLPELRTVQASERAHEAEGFERNLRAAVESSLTALESSKIHNEFVSRMVALVAEPLRDHDVPKKGWIVVRGSLEQGFRENGGSGRRYQIPPEAARRYLRGSPLIKETRAFLEATYSLNRAVKAMLAPGTAFESVLSGGLRLFTKLMIDYFHDSLTWKTSRFRRTAANIKGLSETLKLPDQAARSDWFFGGDQGEMKGEADLLERAQRGLDSIDRFYRRTLVNMEKQHLKLERWDTVPIVSAVNDAVEMFAFDEHSLPLWMKEHGGSPVGPFLARPYQMAKMFSKLAGQAFGPRIQLADRMAAIFTIGVLSSALGYGGALVWPGIKGRRDRSSKAQRAVRRKVVSGAVAPLGGWRSLSVTDG